ncbi:MAG: LacI family DNA-binding transcriptional regulator [Actinomycetaceae bacterium]|nr:LacI family DNA-binding transcriptional regulator [Actinomycetaceae bacterium]
MAEKSRRITRTDVAQLAGVSTAVVSYVMNNGPRPVAPHTRKKVLEAVEALGYQPSASARALKLGMTSTYGLVILHVENAFHAQVVEAVDRTLSSRGLSMVLSMTHDDVDRERVVLDQMIHRGVDGLMVLMSALSDSEWLARRQSVPTILLDRDTGLEGYTTVGPDFEAGGYLATSHLIKHGAKRIIPVTGPLSPGNGNPRYDGYRRAMAEAKLDVLDPITTEWSLVGGYTAGKVILDMAPRADAVFCFSDALAIGLKHAFFKQSIRVPQDIAIVSFDGTDAAKFTYPQLTTVSQPLEPMVEFAVDSVSKRTSSDEYEHRSFPVELRIGNSCGCAVHQ